MKVQAFPKSALLLLAGSLLAHAEARPVHLQPCPEGGFLPEAVADQEGTVHVVFHRGDPGKCDLFHATFSPATRTFSDPVRINSIPGAGIAGGSVRGAHLAIGAEGVLHVAWMGSTETAPDGDHALIPMCYTRSTDGGRSFEPQRSVVNTAFGLDGGGSLAADRKGNVHVVWHAMGDDHGPANRRVVVASSEDNGRSFAPERTLDTKASGVCPCCGIRAASSPQGEFFVLFREAPAADQRGVRILSFDPAKGSTTLLHQDPWKIETCPVSSGSFSFGPSRFAVAWETRHRVQVGTFDRESGRATRSLPVREPEAGRHQKHPAVSLSPDGSLVVAWLEVSGWGQPGTLRWQQFNSGEKAGDQAGHRTMEAAWTRPSIVSTAEGHWLFY